jgi:hypothetical protein
MSKYLVRKNDDTNFETGLSYHRVNVTVTKRDRMSGFCSKGHIFRFHGFIDSEGTWRCKLCRREQENERKYWSLVERYMDGDVKTLGKLQAYWRTP